MINKKARAIYNPIGDNPSERRILSITTKDRADEVMSLFKSVYPYATVKKISEFISEDEHVEVQASELFRACGNCYEVYQDGAYLCVVVETGDWKHDHAHCDHVMETVFSYKCMKEDLWEETHCDCYSATHYYLPNNYTN